MVSIKIRQRDETNDNHMNDEDGDYIALQPDDSTNRNSKYMNLQPDCINSVTDKNAIIVGYTISLLME